MKTRKQVVSLVRFRDIINTASRLALGKIRGTLPKKDARVDALRNSVRVLGETDREILRRDVRHLAVAGEFVRDIGEQQFDLTPEMVSFTFGPLEKELVIAFRRLVKMTGVQVQWVTRDEALVDDESNPTVSALGAAARVMLDAGSTAPAETPASTAPTQTPANSVAEEDDFAAQLERENLLDQRHSEDEAALTLVREWYANKGRFASKERKPAGGVQPAVDVKNAAAVVRAIELAAAGRGTVNTESLPAQASLPVPAAVADVTDDALEVELIDVDFEPFVVPEPPAVSSVEPTLEELAIVVEAKIAEAVAGRQFVQAAALDVELTTLRTAIDVREAEAAARAVEAIEVAAQAEAEVALEPVVETVAANALVVSRVEPPAPIDPIAADFAKLVELGLEGHPQATKLVASARPKDGKPALRTEAEAVRFARVVHLID